MATQSGDTETNKGNSSNSKDPSRAEAERILHAAKKSNPKPQGTPQQPYEPTRNLRQTYDGGGKGFTQPEPKPERSGSEDAAYQAGRGVADLKNAYNKGQARRAPAKPTAPPASVTENKPEADQEQSQAPGPLGNLNADKIKQAATSGDPRSAVAEALTELGAGAKIGDTLFMIWGAFAVVTGAIPILGLFSASSVMLIFNLLLVSPKTVYRITEFILDLVGVGEVLQVLDKAGASKTDITIRGVEKVGILFIDLGFLLWHGIFIAVLIFSICKVTGAASNIPLVGQALDAGAKAGDLITGLPVSQTRQICKAIGINSPSSPSTGSGNTIPGSGTCQIVENPASGCDVQKLTGVCTWDPKLASQICNKESAGGTNPAIGGTADYCYPFGPDGKKLPMSIGYFQLNIFNSYSPEFNAECANVLRNDGCWVDLVNLPGTNIKYCPKRKCSFGPAGEAGYNRCVQALSDGNRNVKQACNLYKRSGWQPWSAAKVCNIIN